MKPRAERFSTQAPLEYRLSGDAGWITGITTNISSSGVLFQAGKQLEPKTMIEMQIHFPGQATGSIPSNLFCRGVVVRTEPAQDEKWQCGIASSIIRHHLVPE